LLATAIRENPAPEMRTVLGDTLSIPSVTGLLALIGGVFAVAAKFIEYRIKLREARAGRKQAPAPEVKLDAPICSLPVQFKGFVNRTRELSTAEERVYEGGEAVLVFEGDRGIGKSTAAVELAHRLQKGEPRGARDLREHEYIWVMGGGESDRGVTLADIGRALNVATEDQSVSAGSESVKLDRLRRHLVKRKTALVLDSLKLSEDDESDGMRAFLNVIPEGSLVIAAVDIRGDGLDAAHVELAKFGVDDVEDLVAKLVERLNLKPAEQFDRALAESLHEIVGGDPRAITWFMQAYKRSGESLAERLAALRSGRGLDRLFAPIWRSLDGGARELLSACDCLGGKATAGQLAAACEVSEQAALQMAEALYDEGLLGVAHSAGATTFVCSQALALYVAGETPPEDRYARLRAVAAHYVSMMRADPENARALLSEVDALRAVFDGLNRHRDDDFEDPRIEAAIQDLFRAAGGALLTLGFFDDRIAAATYTYESSMRTGNFPLASLACEVLASTYALRGEFEPAASALRHGEIAAEESGEDAETARQMYSAAFLRYRERAPEEALALIEGADDLALAGDDLEGLIDILDMRSAAHLYLGDVDSCEADARRSLALCEEIRWERAKSFPLRFLAEVEIKRGNSKAAHRVLERARAFAYKYDDQRQLARISLTTARKHLLDRELDTAEAAAADAVDEAQRLALPPEEAEALALVDAVELSRRSPTTLDRLVSERPTRLTDEPVAGD